MVDGVAVPGGEALAGPGVDQHDDNPASVVRIEHIARDAVGGSARAGLRARAALDRLLVPQSVLLPAPTT